MNKTKARKSNFKLFLFAFMVFLLFVACGIDVYYIIEPPKNPKPNSGSEDPLQSYFEFTTADTDNHDTGIVGDVESRGTEIYYKIYTSLDSLNTQKDAIDKANTEYSESGYNKMMSYEYKKLGFKDESPIIKALEDSKVTIRLFPINEETPSIKVNDSDIAEPLRYNFEEFSFNGEDSIAGDDVAESTTTGELNEIWINAYAVSVGSVNRMQYVYSSLCPLGYLKYEIK